MQNSAEVRWFWPNLAAKEIESWFRSHEPSPGGGERREDDYLIDPDQVELGIKQRGKKKDGVGIEVKGLVARLPAQFAIGTLIGHGELWTKWTSPTLKLGGMPTVRTYKVRWLRKYEVDDTSVLEIPLNEKEDPCDPDKKLPKQGCNLEFTKVSLTENGPEWCTIGFESFGSHDAVEAILRRTFNYLSTGSLPTFVPGEELSYPAWLALQNSPRGGTT